MLYVNFLAVVVFATQACQGRTDYVPDSVPDNIANHVPGSVVDNVPGNVVDDVADHVANHVADHMPDTVSETVLPSDGVLETKHEGLQFVLHPNSIEGLNHRIEEGLYENLPANDQNVNVAVSSQRDGTLQDKHNEEEENDYPSHEKDLPPAQYDWGGLYPKESISREVKSLDGIWNFRISPKGDAEKGFRESWFAAPLSATGEVIAMPVPSSYNDITQDKQLRDHIGWAWYDTTFIVPQRWQQDDVEVMLRFGSIHYNSIIYLNGDAVTSHIGGHLPVLACVRKYLKYGEENLLIVALNNTLTPKTIPQGSIVHHSNPARYPPGYFEQKYNFDFFNYAGIHRPVFLYTTPRSLHIDDVHVVTTIDKPSGDGNNPVAYIHYNISYSGVDADDEEQGSKRAHGGDSSQCYVKLLDHNGTQVTSDTGCAGVIKVEDPHLWWPYLMHPQPGYQYTLMVHVGSSKGAVVDVYPLKVGLREVGWTNTSLTINGRPLYIRGCGKHEDSDLRGKGYDAALVVKDFVLLKWLGANTFRTSHYPYAEEIMDRADAEGIMVIDESPAIGLSGFDAELEARHIAVMKEFIARDKNRPSVIMWSVGNEPKSSQLPAHKYFQAVVGATKAMDRTRPVTCVLSVGVLQDLAAAPLDVIWVNRYFSWYSDTGHLELIHRQTVAEFTEWHSRYNKPVGISEYGAGTMPGMHISPSFTWSEEYQAELLLNNFPAFDELRDKGFFIGEMIWNFADFMTPQGFTRVGGNKKGIFTRSRQPKAAAWLLKYRYERLAAGDIWSNGGGSGTNTNTNGGGSGTNTNTHGGGSGTNTNTNGGGSGTNTNTNGGGSRNNDGGGGGGSGCRSCDDGGGGGGRSGDGTSEVEESVGFFVVDQSEARRSVGKSGFVSSDGSGGFGTNICVAPLSVALTKSYIAGFARP